MARTYEILKCGSCGRNERVQTDFDPELMDELLGANQCFDCYLIQFSPDEQNRILAVIGI